MTVEERRQREREARRDAILDAVERVVRDKGLDQLTVDDVANEAELGKGTLYLYFRNREDLILGVVLRNQRALLAGLRTASEGADSGLSQLRRILLAHYDFMVNQHGCLRGMLRGLTAEHPPFDAQTSGYRDFVANLAELHGALQNAIERGQKDGSLSAVEDVRVASIAVWAAMKGALVLYLQAERLGKDLPTQVAPDSAARGLIELLLRGLGALQPTASTLEGDAS